MHYFDYLKIQNTVISDIKKDDQFKDANPTQLFDEVLKSRTGSTGFVGFVKDSAKRGVTIGRDGANLGETGTWIYWLIELGVIQALIVYTAISGAKDPFCESSNDWYKSVENVGNVDASVASNFLELITNDRFAEAGAFVESGSETITADSLAVTKQVSPTDPEADVFLKISKIKVNQEGKLDLKEIISGLVSAMDYQRFQSAVKTWPIAEAPENDQ
jgi:hypothetical protein